MDLTVSPDGSPALSRKTSQDLDRALRVEGRRGNQPLDGEVPVGLHHEIVQHVSVDDDVLGEADVSRGEIDVLLHDQRAFDADPSLFGYQAAVVPGHVLAVSQYRDVVSRFQPLIRSIREGQLSSRHGDSPPAFHACNGSCQHVVLMHDGNGGGLPVVDLLLGFGMRALSMEGQLEVQRRRVDSGCSSRRRDPLERLVFAFRVSDALDQGFPVDSVRDARIEHGVFHRVQIERLALSHMGVEVHNGKHLVLGNMDKDCAVSVGS
jgi:hypothetical protein